MKKSVIAIIVLAAMMFTATANANLIGVFADPAGTDCDADLGAQTAFLYVLAILSDIDAIRTAEFKLCGVTPPALTDGLFLPQWNGPLTIGDVLGVGVSVAWSTPQPGPIVVLGQIIVAVYNPLWMPANSIWCVCETEDSGLIVLVDGEFVSHDAIGYCFVANCVPDGPFGDCSCGVIPVEDTSWGAVKSLY